MMDEAIGSLRFHKLIYSDWGFAEVDPTGRNMAINFYGPPGTGKTLAAEALAGTLGLKFIHIGISEIESKFVGETAKNISAAFQEAALQGALLFFDEADTLLGARLSSVTQGVDHEINAMRSTMLIELERFNGIVVFATNFAKQLRRRSLAARFDILQEIEKILPGFPIVLHGSSSVPVEAVKLISQYGGKMKDAVGIPEEQLRQAARSAVCKINIDSDLRLGFTAGVRQTMMADPSLFDPRGYLKVARQNVKDIVTHKIIEVLGSNGKA